jgi:hypothetical protein
MSTPHTLALLRGFFFFFFATDLQKHFSSFFDLPQDSQQSFAVRKGAFCAFLKAILERRSQHVAQWLSENMAAFLDDPEALAIQVRSYLQSLQAFVYAVLSPTSVRCCHRTKEIMHFPIRK